MKHWIPSLLVAVTTACGSAAPVALHPEVMAGSVTDPAGKVLVLSATCGSVEQECRETWAPAVDSIVVSGLEFHGFATIDPATLRRDERAREETTSTGQTVTQVDSKSSSGGIAIVGIIPVGAIGTASEHSVTVVDTKQKTVVLQGASFEDLRLEDRQHLMQLADAGSVLTTRVTVGANYGNWSAKQTVEVMVKLASPTSGEMLWSTRCSASSEQFASVDQAIEEAARCAVAGITGA